MNKLSSVLRNVAVTSVRSAVAALKKLDLDDRPRPLVVRTRLFAVDSGRSVFSASVVVFLALFLAGGCVSGGPPIEGYEDVGPAGYGVTPSGSGDVQPPESWREEPTRERPLFRPRIAKSAELPQERLAKLRSGMTEAELLKLLGEPESKRTLQQDPDTGRDWNARVWSWKYQDSRFSSAPLDRDLEVRLAEVTARDHALGLTSVVGPTWVVAGWSLD